MVVRTGQLLQWRNHGVGADPTEQNSLLQGFGACPVCPLGVLFLYVTPDVTPPQTPADHLTCRLRPRGRTKKHVPNERTELNSRRRMKQNRDKQSIKYRVQNTDYKDIQ